jgi:hypothetical protein
VNVPDGAVARAALFQHATVPSERMPHGYWTCTNVPLGGIGVNDAPQHASVPSVRTPHALSRPADTCENVPAGGVVTPKKSALPPARAQHATVSSRRSPQTVPFDWSISA